MKYLKRFESSIEEHYSQYFTELIDLGFTISCMNAEFITLKKIDNQFSDTEFSIVRIIDRDKDYNASIFGLNDEFEYLSLPLLESIERLLNIENINRCDVHISKGLEFNLTTRYNKRIAIMISLYKYKL